MKYFIIVLAIRNVKTESKHKRDKSNICLGFISFAGCRIFTKKISNKSDIQIHKCVIYLRLFIVMLDMIISNF